MNIKTMHELRLGKLGADFSTDFTLFSSVAFIGKIRKKKHCLLYCVNASEVQMISS